MQAGEEVLEVDASGGRGVEVSSSGGRGVGGKCKQRERCWR